LDKHEEELPRWAAAIEKLPTYGCCEEGHGRGAWLLPARAARAHRPATIEVRFYRSSTWWAVAEAEVRVGNIALPTVLNAVINALEEAANVLRILPNRKRTMPILHGSTT
jgi:hypothetical protein